MAYLIDNPPVRDQFYAKRNRPLTGATVLHTAEGVLDTIGPDTGAEATADFIRRRTTPGSYHDIADSDSYINLVPYESGAYHDGTGSNNWALSISFACRTTDWWAMTPEKRAGFLRQGARAFAAQQAWRKRNGAPLTELRLITKAQSDAGVSGFTYHGLRDPSRRTDPGTTPAAPFPFDEFMTYCRAALAGTPLEEDDMSQYAEQLNRIEARLLGDAAHRGYDMLQSIESMTADVQARVRGGHPAMDSLQVIQWQIAQVAAAAPDGGGDDLAGALAAAIPADLAEQVAAKLAERLAA